MIEIVCLPGLDGTGLLLSPLVDQLRQRLSADFKVKVISYPPERILSTQQLVELIAKQLPQRMPFWLLAESYGGPLAVLLASRPNCLGLILSASFVRNPRPVLSLAYPVARYIPIGPKTRAAFARIILGRFWSARLAELMMRAGATVPASVFKARLHDVITTDVRSRFASLPLPMLVLRAEQDWLVPASAAKIMAGLNARCEVTDMIGPHGLLQAQPAEAAELVRQFILRHAPPAHD